jgi:hypothetical protein
MSRVIGKPFEKGKSGNPNGRPKVVAEVQELARTYTTEAVDTLVKIMKAKSEPAAARVAAANSILDRGYGKPAVTVDATIRRDVSEIADAELAAIAAASGTGAVEPADSAPGPDSVH